VYSNIVAIMPKKICIIGLDGINNTVAKIVGLNHGFTKLTLISTIPPYTPPAWTSILSGVNPGTHGVYGFLGFKNGNVYINYSWSVKYPRLFEILAMCGLKSIVVNVPLSYPFNALVLRNKYIVISDWASPTQVIWPPKLHRKYREYLVEPPHKWFQHSSVREYASVLREYSGTRLNLYLDLLERNDWSLYFIVFSETDWLLHRIPELLEGKNVTLIQPVISIIKKFIRKALELSDLIIIVSDHGFEVKRWAVNVNAFLRDRGLLRYGYVLNSDYSTRKFISQKSQKTLFQEILRNMTAVASTIFPQRQVLMQLLIRKLRGRVPIVSAIDINSSLAFMIESPSWGVYVNEVAGAEGIKKVLRRIPGVKTVLRSEDVFFGPHVRYAPQLIVLPDKGVRLCDDPYGDAIKQIYEGDHEIHGVFMVTGDEVNRNSVELKTATVYDVTPTVLYYMGLPLPKQCEGKPLKELFCFDQRTTERYDYLTKFRILRTRERLRKARLV